MNFKRPCFLAFILFFAFGYTGYGQSAFTLESVMSSGFPSGVVRSASGEKIAWIQYEEGVRNIWVAEAPQFTARQLTKYDGDDGQAISNLQYAPDESSIIYVRGGAPNRRGEIPNPNLSSEGAERVIYRVNFRNGEVSKVVAGASPSISPNGNEVAFVKGGKVWTIALEEDAKAAQLFSMRGSASQLRWSPGGESIAFVSNRGTHGFVGIYHLENKNITYLSPSVDSDSSPAWSPDGTKIAFRRTPQDSNQLPFKPRRSALPWSIWVGDVASGNASKIWEANEGVGSVFRSISASNQIFWGAGSRIVFPWEGDGWTHLYSVSMEGGDAVLLTPGNFEVQFVSMGLDNRSVYYSSNQGDIDRQHVWQVNVAGGAATQLTHGSGIEWSPLAVDGGMVTLASSGKVPAHVLFVKSNGQSTVIAGPSEDFPTANLVEPEQVVFSAADGMKIHGQLFKPKGMQEGERRPAILFFHGGSRRQMLLGFHHRGYYHNSYAFNQYLANKGYIVLSVNYRSGIGYGMAFREAIDYGATGASEYKDVVGAGLYMQRREDVDPDRIGLWGGSYGGYLTALGLARASDLFAAGVDVHGVHDWNVVIRNFAPSYDAAAAAETARIAFESSPMADIDSWKSPVLLIHGDDDRNVPFSESVDLAEALRKQGVYFEQLIFPDDVHSFLLHQNWLAAFHAAADFFDRHLK